MRAQLEAEKYGQLALMYRLFAPVENGRDLLRNILFEYVKGEGQSLV